MIRDTTKTKKLLEQEKRILRTSDLAVLWGVTNKNTLLTTIKRYVKKGILHRIQKGLYSTVPIKKLHKYELGCAVAGSLAYVSTETVLKNEGVIMQSLNVVTLVGKKKMEFEIGEQRYFCRYLNSKYLVNQKGVLDKRNYSIAALERAVADLLHFDPKYYFDNDSPIDKKELEKIQEALGYQ